VISLINSTTFEAIRCFRMKIIGSISDKIKHEIIFSNKFSIWKTKIDIY